MSNANVVWLASYPRSGNTLLRTVLWHCFGMRSASIYGADLGGNIALEEYVGHIEHGPDRQIVFPAGSLPLLKTHAHPSDDAPALYVIRDGRAACVSLWRFYEGVVGLDAIIAGRLQFGTWSAHVEAWDPWNRPNTLLLRYEDLCHDLMQELPRISRFLHRDILRPDIPDRRTVSQVDGRWVREESDWRASFPQDLLSRYNAINHATMVKAGYSLGEAARLADTRRAS